MAKSQPGKIKGSAWPKNGRWVAQLPPSMGRKSETFDTEAEARLWLAERNANPTTVDAPRVSNKATVAEVAQSWLQNTPLKETSRAAYAGTIRQYLDNKPLGRKRISAVLPADINHAMMAAPQNWSVRRFGIVLSGLFHWAEINGLVNRNPYRASDHKRITGAIRKARPPRSSVEAVWSLEEVGSFIRSETDPVLKRLWLFIASTGARRGESLGLRWPNIHDGWCWLEDNITEVKGASPTNVGTPKSGMKRKAFFGEFTAAALKAQRADQDAYRATCAVWLGEEWVFDRRRLQRRKNVIAGYHLSPQPVTIAFNRLSEELALPHLSGPHGLRRSLATVLSKEGFDHRVRQAVLGHTPGVTDAYSKVSDSERREVAARIDQLLREAIEGK